MRGSFDAIVLGGGAWGSAATQHLAARHHRVLCVDRFLPPHTRGSTHGHSRTITTAAISTEADLPLIQRSYELWRELEKATSRQLLERVGYLYVGSPASRRITRSAEILDRAMVHTEMLSDRELSRRFPQFRFSAGEVGIFDPDGASLDPEACVSAALQIAVAHDAILRFGEPILGWTATANGVKVVTAEDEYHADWMILAVGPWISWLAGIELPTRVERQVMVWYECLDSDISGFSFPALSPAVSVYGLPEPGARVKVALHHGGAPADPNFVPPVATSDIQAIRSAIEDRIQVLGRIIGSATCMYTNSPDGAFMIGAHPYGERVIVLTGESGRGFHQAQVIGEYVADHVEGRSRLDFARFAPDRFGLAALRRDRGTFGTSDPASDSG